MELYLFILLFIIFFLIGYFLTTGIKSQWVRLFDIFVYGPILIWLSSYQSNTILSVILLFIGTTTISYNLRNYMYQQDKNVEITNPASWSV